MISKRIESFLNNFREYGAEKPGFKIPFRNFLNKSSGFSRNTEREMSYTWNWNTEVIIERYDIRNLYKDQFYNELFGICNWGDNYLYGYPLLGAVDFTSRILHDKKNQMKNMVINNRILDFECINEMLCCNNGFEANNYHPYTPSFNSFTYIQWEYTVNNYNIGKDSQNYFWLCCNNYAYMFGTLSVYKGVYKERNFGHRRVYFISPLFMTKELHTIFVKGNDNGYINVEDKDFINKTTLNAKGILEVKTLGIIYIGKDFRESGPVTSTTDLFFSKNFFKTIKITYAELSKTNAERKAIDKKAWEKSSIKR